MAEQREGRTKEEEANLFLLLLLMICSEDPGEPLALIDVKCVILLLIKAEASNITAALSPV